MHGRDAGPGSAGAARARGPALDAHRTAQGEPSEAWLSLPYTIHRSAVTRICLLGGFRLVAGGNFPRVSAGGEHLLAFLALCRSAVPRALVAGTLWPDVSEDRAHACLRSALTRLHGTGRRAIDIGPADLGLSDGITVDLHEGRMLARSILDTSEPAEEMGAAEIAELSQDLLPGWCDEWALREAEEWRQLRLHALEALAARFTTAGRFAHAVAAAGSAVRAEPLRESAQLALVKAHLAEGNQSEALRGFHRYRCLLQAELGLSPTPQMLELVHRLRLVASR